MSNSHISVELSARGRNEIKQTSVLAGAQETYNNNNAYPNGVIIMYARMIS